MGKKIVLIVKPLMFFVYFDNLFIVYHGWPRRFFLVCIGMFFESIVSRLLNRHHLLVSWLFALPHSLSLFTIAVWGHFKHFCSLNSGSSKMIKAILILFSSLSLIRYLVFLLLNVVFVLQVILLRLISSWIVDDGEMIFVDAATKAVWEAQISFIRIVRRQGYFFIIANCANRHICNPTKSQSCDAANNWLKAK